MSKLPDPDDDPGELHEAEKIAWMVGAANDETTLSLNSCEKPFHNPVTFRAPQSAAILILDPCAVAFVQRDHRDAVLSQLFIQRNAVVCTITNQSVGLRFNHVEIKTQLHLSHFAIIGGTRTDS